MSKAPAFPMYAADFLVDTSEWTDEEVGRYTRLLLTTWVNGDISSERKRHPFGGTKKRVWNEIYHKFFEKNAGRLVNLRLEKQREIQAAHKEALSSAGKRGAAKRWDGEANGPPISPPNGKTMALQSSSSSKSKNIPTYIPPPECVKLATRYLERQRERKPNLSHWDDFDKRIADGAKNLDLYITQNKWTIKKITAVLKWMLEDDFHRDQSITLGRIRTKWKNGMLPLEDADLKRDSGDAFPQVDPVIHVATGPKEGEGPPPANFMDMVDEETSRERT